MSQLFPVAMMRLAIRRLMAIYLVIAAVALAFPYRPAAWLPLAAAHAIAVLLLLDVAPFRQQLASLKANWPLTTRVMGDWYPLVLIPALYSELAPLNVAVFNGHYFDSIILGWEQAIFGGLPSSEWAAAMPNLALSEVLHFSYISYYLIIYGPPIYLYLSGRHDAFQRVVFTVMFTFLAHYIFFIYFPVQGPRYLFPAPGGELSNGFFYNLAHKLLETGSSRGAAFPSSHVGVAFAQTALAFVLLKRAAPWLLVLSTGLVLGAIYGGFHYATDAAVGLGFGLILFAVAPRAAQRLAGRSVT